MMQPGRIKHFAGVWAHRVSLVAVCCRDSSLSWSDCSGRMFFSSSSLFDGRLLSLMARESFRKTFMASVPSMIVPEAKMWVNTHCELRSADSGCCELSLHKLTVRGMDFLQLPNIILVVFIILVHFFPVYSCFLTWERLPGRNRRIQKYLISVL